MTRNLEVRLETFWVRTFQAREYLAEVETNV
jgi:hypothetical protein